MTISAGHGRLLWLLGALYFAQGLPFGLLARSLPAIARDAGLSPELIGLLALPAAPWALKFLWAPFVDQYGRGRPGHRRRWIIACQLAAMGLLAVVALQPPEQLFGSHFALFLVLLFALNALFATHDIATDGLAVRLLPVHLRGMGNSLQTGGYKSGLILGSALLLMAVEVLGWRAGWLIVLALLALSLLPWRGFDEPAEAVRPTPLDRRAWLREFTGFWQRPGMKVWLLVLIGYKICDSFGSRMLKPFLVDAGWSLSAIGRLDLVTSLVGLAGAVLAGLLLLRLSHRSALVLFGLGQALAFAGWALLGERPDVQQVWLMASVEQLADGLATVALFTLMMDRCRRDHDGSDYTMQASVVLAFAGLATLVSGVSVKLFGYSAHFLLSAGLGLAAIIPAFFIRPAISGAAHALHADNR
ncbi:MAG: MFS transporter [Alcanivoracaceae bacterium]|nr:MFS transporter [Alcanivoracaceae bacterium]